MVLLGTTLALESRSDWRDPRLQSRFAAWNLKTNNPSTSREMLGSDRFHAAAAYVDEYVKAAATYRVGRMSRYLHGGVSPLESYTGPRDLLSNAAAAGVGGGTQKIEGGADLALHSRARLPAQKRACNRGVFFPMSEKSIGALACRYLTQDTLR